jgi:hypothetical protein
VHVKVTAGDLRWVISSSSERGGTQWGTMNVDFCEHTWDPNDGKVWFQAPARSRSTPGAMG